MALNKRGTPTKLKVVKQSAFEVDLNVLASMLKEQWPDKTLSVNALHEALKNVGITEYKAEDMQELIGRLQAIGFTIKQENV
jgi:hypothetical protein